MLDARLSRMQTKLVTASQRKNDPSRHRCFISYHLADSAEVEQFVDQFGSEFIGTCLGVTDQDDFVDSTDEDYIKRRIREEHLSSTTVTIVMLGRCTWARKFVDWEVSSSLRSDPVNTRNGLLAIPLPSMNNSARLPDRVRDNWIKDAESYALYRSYPSSASEVRSMVEQAFQHRTSALPVDNSRPLRSFNATC